ncbi:DUF3558 family protein [Micromonospora sp. C31]|uniref:DUF3558 family protein n=1 Tax=Micromonospora sp. C31 TaxID=2824876 RepID=UPI001B35EDFB|nr:DUF3558 family protein [Micromonospora sp. C31]MBQ1076608.1 DUF3558 family protein [Micromonospora sp. C31]
MKHRLVTLAALVAVCLTTGCDLIESTTAEGPPTAGATIAPTAGASAATPSATDAAAATPSATGGGSSGLVKDSGDIPDPCTLLTGAEVVELTGRTVIRRDEDGGDAGDVTRFCQWQQASGQLAVCLSRTTAVEFGVTVAAAKPVDGVGEEAHWHSGHLYFLHGTVQIDVYSRGGSDAQNLADARQVAQVLVTRV